MVVEREGGYEREPIAVRAVTWRTRANVRSVHMGAGSSEDGGRPRCRQTAESSAKQGRYVADYWLAISEESPSLHGK